MVQQRRGLLGVLREQTDTFAPFLGQRERGIYLRKVPDNVLNIQVGFHAAIGSAGRASERWIADGNMRDFGCIAIFAVQNLAVKNHSAADALLNVQTDDI